MRRCIVLVLCALALAGWQRTPWESPFAEVYFHVKSQFFDQQRTVEWESRRSEFEHQFDEAATVREKCAVINEWLSQLKASHTELVGPWDPHFYHLRAVFRDDDRSRYPGIGIEAIEQDGKTFVRWVYGGTPAAVAGLQVGDEIVAVDGEPFAGVESFLGKEHRIAQLRVRRRADGPVEEIACVVAPLDGETVFLEAQRASARVIKRDDVSIAYVHVWSYAGDEYQDALREAVLSSPLSDADVLVLDLRGGLGGAQVEYLRLFDRSLPTAEFRSREGTWRATRSTWIKPVVLLIDETSRSGKEVFAYGFKKMKRGPVVGARTAGAVVGGRLFNLQDGTALYLAVSDVRIGGERLEGVGVEPDIEVPFELPYANGADPRLEKALDVATELVREARAERDEADAVP